jgi:hypothetical protein
MSWNDFMNETKKNPELLKMGINEICSKYNLTSAETEKCRKFVESCKGLSKQELAARISAGRVGGGGTLP